MSGSKPTERESLSALCELLALSRRLAREMPSSANPALKELCEALACAEISAARLAAEKVVMRRRARA
jgi:hypothetical protein